MSQSADKPRKIRKRRTTGTVGGTTQSGFANRSMSDLLKQQEQAPAEPKRRSDQDGESDRD